jgi:hypothetical protein
VARLFLIIVIALAAYIIWLRFQNLPAAQRKNTLWQVFAITGGTLLLLLVVTGRLHWLGALAAAAIPLLKRLLPLSLPYLHQHFTRRGKLGPSTPNQHSSVDTDILSMSLDHDSGQIGGVVTSGPFKGQQLAHMSDSDLLALYQYCCQQDSDSARLLQGYLDQRLGSDWQANDPGQQTGTAGAMPRSEALAILGLDDGANREQILLAHRRLMQKLHPDRGGNDYLAAQLNQARDTLLS